MTEQDKPHEGDVLSSPPGWEKMFIYGPGAYDYFYERSEIPDEPCEWCEVFWKGEWRSVYRRADHAQENN